MSLLYGNSLTSSLLTLLSTSVLIIYSLSTLSLYLEIKAPDFLLSFLFIILISLVLIIFATFFTFILLLFKINFINIFKIFPKCNLVIYKVVVYYIRLRLVKGASAFYTPILRHLYNIIIYRYGVLALISRGSNF